MTSFSKAARVGSSVYFAETEDLAAARFYSGGGNRQSNRLYATRLAACINACAGISTEELEAITATGGMLGPRADIAAIAKQRDDLLAALVRALHKLTAYIGVFNGDKELTEAVLPMVRAAIASTETPGKGPAK